MVTNTFNSSNPRPNPPAYCWYRKVPLPPILPLFPAPELNGYARWTDLDPLAPCDVAIFTTLQRTAGQWLWTGGITKGAVTLFIALHRTADPQPWRLEIRVYDPWRTPEIAVWEPLTMQLEPAWDTGLLTSVHIPAIDFREARVTQ